MRDEQHGPRVYLQPAFLICVGILVVACAGMSFAIRAFGVVLSKEPTPLRKSLDLLDETRLGPYRVVPRGKLKIQNEDVLRSLGTEDYIQWIIEDTEQETRSPVGRLMLFITYYQMPDRVPHVPEECHAGAGYQRLATDSVKFGIPRDGRNEQIPGRYLVFGSKTENFLQAGGKFPVLYLFRVNEQYAGNRDDARIMLNKNLFGKHSYFSKIELAFNQTVAAPSKEEAVQASEKLLTLILPILEEEHWPDLDGK